MQSQSDSEALRSVYAFFTNYEDSPNHEVEYADKMKNMTHGPDRLYDFFEFLLTFINRSRTEQGITDCQPLIDVLSLTIRKASMLRTLGYFERANCLNVKICFGLDECLIPQLIVSGSFYCPDQQPVPNLVDNPFQKSVIEIDRTWFI